MSIVWQDVVNIAPELVNIPTAAQTGILAMVDNQIDDAAWSGFGDDGRKWLAAHIASLKGNRGFVTGEGLGPMRMSYAMAPGVRSELGQTTYGIEYLRLLRIAIGIPGLVP